MFIYWRKSTWITKGSRPQKIISDDILSDQQVRSMEQREITLNWYKKALSEALSSDGVLEVLNTPLHPDDIIMTIFKGEAPFNTWDVIKLPALENGKTVDKDWKTTKELQEKSKDEYTFQQELMCNPLRVDSGLIKYDDLCWYKKLPKIKASAIHADTTHTGKSTSDYFAMAIIGESTDGYYYLIDYIIEKCTVDKQVDYLIEFYKKHNDKNIYRITYDEKSPQGS